MRTSLVLTAIGDDKPGIVEQLSDQIFAAGANWEESRMARLGGKFAGVLRVSVDAERADDLEAALRRAAGSSLAIVVARSAERVPAAVQTTALEIVGDDRPGIIRDISRVLAQRQVNILELETDVTTAPMSGEPLFRARASIRIPPSTDVDQLRGVLEAIAHELMVELALEPDGQALASRIA